MAYSNPALNLKNLVNIQKKMAQDKISMPQGMGGLVRYFDEYQSKVKFKPGHIIVLCIVVIVIMLFLYSYGNRFLGIG